MNDYIRIKREEFNRIQWEHEEKEKFFEKKIRDLERQSLIKTDMICTRSRRIRNLQNDLADFKQEKEDLEFENKQLKNELDFMGRVVERFSPDQKHKMKLMKINRRTTQSIEKSYQDLKVQMTSVKKKNEKMEEEFKELKKLFEQREKDFEMEKKGILEQIDDMYDYITWMKDIMESYNIPLYQDENVDKKSTVTDNEAIEDEEEFVPTIVENWCDECCSDDESISENNEHVADMQQVEPEEVNISVNIQEEVAKTTSEDTKPKQKKKAKNQHTKRQNKYKSFVVWTGI